MPKPNRSSAKDLILRFTKQKVLTTVQRDGSGYFEIET